MQYKCDDNDIHTYTYLHPTIYITECIVQMFAYHMNGIFRDIHFSKRWNLYIHTYLHTYIITIIHIDTYMHFLTLHENMKVIV